MRKKPLSYLSGFSAELLRRRVYPVVVTYALAAWVLLQIAEVTFEPLGLPGWMMRALIFAVIAGFPVATVLAWKFDMTLWGIRREPRPMTAGAALAGTASIAVLPFTDMSQKKDQGYFCEGVAEEILNALSTIDTLKVVARTSSFRYASAGGDPREIGKNLGANTILEGSVRKSGDRLRITAELVNVEDGYQLWSKAFNRKLEDIFSIQDEIATSIAEALLDTLMKIRTTATRDVEAYEYYLRGKQFLNRFRKVDIEFARHMFEKAIENDPQFALAWAAYADVSRLK